jgi:hypothetical protein
MSEQNERKPSKEELEQFLGKSIEEIETLNLKKQEVSEKSEEEPKEPEKETKTIPGERTLKEDTANNSKAVEFHMEKPVENITVTDQEKEAFFKMMLHDQPFELEIDLMGGKFPVLYRARTDYEQTMLVIVVDALARTDPTKQSLVQATSLLQNFLLVTMIKSIDGKPFPTVHIEKDTESKSPLDDIKQKLQDAVAEHLDPLQGPKKDLLIKGLQLFESKVLLMKQECLNKDFWEPVG